MKQTHMDDVKEGDVLIPDGGFTCMTEGTEKTVFESEGLRCVACEDGHHILEGQRGDDDTLVGFEKKEQ